MPAWATALLPLLLYQGTVPLHAAADRSNSFIGYSEKATFCEDTLWDCVPRARRNGCIYDPFRLRRHCPTTCTIERCSYHGSIRARHRGHATADGTLAYSQLMSAQYHLRKDFYRMVQIKAADEQLMLSPMGIGTYLGEADAHTDEAVVNAILFTVSHGWNVIDTASNYRWGRAEASVGTALTVMLAGDSASSFARESGAPTRQSLQGRLGPVLAGEPDAEAVEQLGGAAVTASHQGGDITRDMLFISTKAGFTTPELVDDLIKQRVMGFGDVVSGMHSIHPAYVKASLMQSLSRLHLETVDLFYLHNSAEVQLPSVGRDKYMERLLAAFRACEELRADGKIQAYGLATWDCFRKPPEDPLYLSLADVVELAQRAGGADHGFRFVQLPVNVGMPEAWLEPYQLVDGRSMTLIEAARQLQVGVMTSKPLGDGGLASSLAQHLDQAQELSGLTSAPSKLLQYARSVDGVITTLVGHKSQSNAETNIRVSLRAPLDHEQFISAHRTIAESRLRAKNANQH